MSVPAAGLQRPSITLRSLWTAHLWQADGRFLWRVTGALWLVDPGAISRSPEVVVGSIWRCRRESGRAVGVVVVGLRNEDN